MEINKRGPRAKKLPNSVISEASMYCMNCNCPDSNWTNME